MHDILNIPPKTVDFNHLLSPVVKTRRTLILEKARQNSTKGNAQGKMKLISYCPHCESNAGSRPFVTVSNKSKNASCKNGHRWEIQ